MNALDPTLSDVTYELECEALPGVPLAVSDLRIVEALNEPYKLEVRVGLPANPLTHLDLGLWLGRASTLHLSRRTRGRLFHGIVREVHEGEHADERGAWARVVIVPALWMLSLSRDTRIFQEMTVIEILGSVLTTQLARFGRAVVFQATRPYPRREYCVQYQESHLDFVHRLMEEEGLGYSFDHVAGREVMIVHDSNHLFTPVETNHFPGLVTYEPHNLEVATSEPVVAFHLEREETINRVMIRDFDWTQPGTSPEGRALRPELGQRGHASYEHGIARSLCIWSYGESSAKYQAHDGAQQAELRLETYENASLIGSGRGRVTSFSPGKRFILSGHPTIGADGDYLLTRVEHSARYEGDTAADPYVNRFECIPYARMYRPARKTEKPRIASVQTATVVGPAGEEIHTDVHGRIKVRFHWDQQHPYDDSASCWVRVQQAWAGAGWGVVFLPRIGMEVVVTFVDGDPDRPLVTGAVYNGANPPPYLLPDEKTKSTINSDLHQPHPGCIRWVRVPAAAAKDRSEARGGGRRRDFAGSAVLRS